MSSSSSLAGGQEAAAAPASADKRHAAGKQAFGGNRRHWQTATARAVKRTTMRGTKKARATRARATRAMTETSPSKEGDINTTIN
jgi:hypothetical protein